VISSEYTINECVHNVPKQNLKIIQEYLHNAHRQNLKSIYHYNKRPCDTVLNSRVTKVLFHCVK